MNPSETESFKVLLSKFDEALREQSELSSIDLQKLIQECENLRTLQEVFANSIEEPAMTYTRA